MFSITIDKPARRTGNVGIYRRTRLIAYTRPSGRVIHVPRQHFGVGAWS